MSRTGQAPKISVSFAVLVCIFWLPSERVALAADSGVPGQAVAQPTAKKKPPKKPKPTPLPKKKGAKKPKPAPPPIVEAPEPEPPVAAPVVEPIPASEKADSFDFDLNVSPTTKVDTSAALTPPVDEKAVKLRRTMLTVHQAIGIALTATTLGSVITGQLSYDDKFEGPNSARYELAHNLFVWPTEGLATVTAALAIFAPVPIAKNGGFDRMTVHRIGMYTAYAAWLTEIVLGVLTTSREGFANQLALANAHLAIGYISLAGMTVGVGAIVF